MTKRGARRRAAAASRARASRTKNRADAGSTTPSLRHSVTPSLLPTPLDLYELCVQSPRHLVPLLRAIHGGSPRVLGEDFSGTAALSREWVRAVKGGRAIAVDLDEEPLARAKARGVTVIRGDALKATDPKRHGADVIFVGNFSIGEIHRRRDLVRYLRHARSRLERAGEGGGERGVFICDTYGGASAFTTGAVQRVHPGPGAFQTRYTWEQREADPLTGEVVNALHFRVMRAGEVELELTDAFIYRWRLWSVPELRDAMSEAGFATTEVYDKVPGAVDQHGNAYIRPAESAELGESFIVCVVGRA